MPLPSSGTQYVLPATGSEIIMGRVKQAYSNAQPGPGQNIGLSSTLGGYVGQSSGTQITLSSRFGGKTTPYGY
jgi:hypothetical protein